MANKTIEERLREHLKGVERKLMWYEHLEKNKGQNGFEYYPNWRDQIIVERPVYQEEERRLLEQFPELSDKIKEIREEIKRKEEKPIPLEIHYDPDEEDCHGDYDAGH